MIKAGVLKAWLASIDDESNVAIDEGGLTMELVGTSQAYIEIGGEPEGGEEKDINDLYIEHLNEIGIPDHDLESDGGRIPDGENYGEWIRDNDPVAFSVGRNEWVREHNL